DLVAGVVVEHERSGGNAQREVVAAGAVLILAAAVLTASRAQGLRVGEIEKRGEPAVDREQDVAALAAVAAVGSAVGHVFLTAEAHASVAARAGLYADADLVHELHFLRPRGAPARIRCLRAPGLLGRCGGRDDADALARLAEPLVADRALDQREDRPVAPDADVRARVDACTHLSHEDVARMDTLATEHLDAAPLPRRIA